MKLSVIIPTYMPGAYINECLDSLCAQTLDHHDFEVIIVLNGPKEPFYDQLQTHPILKGDISVNLLYSEEEGVSRARNTALDVVQGDYVCFIDDDDFVSPDYLEQLYAMADGRDDCIVASNVKGYDEETSNEVDDYLGLSFEQCRHLTSTSPLRMHAILSSSCCKTISLSVIGGRRFNTAFRLGEDALFMASISDRIKCVKFTSSQTIYYRRLRAESALRRHYPISFFAKNAFSLWRQYIGIYLSDMQNYSFPFFANRLMAVAKSHLNYILKSQNVGIMCFL